MLNEMMAYTCLMPYFAALLFFTSVGWASPHFNGAKEELSETGYIQLSWTSENPTNYVLEKSEDESFVESEVIYEGSEKQMFLSGLSNGEFFFRVKEVDSELWSESKKLSVRHHPLSLSLTLFFAGLLTFLCLCWVISKSHRESEKANIHG